MMSRLASTRDGILVSLETITDYSLRPGDLLRLRVLDQRTGKFRVVPFHVVGTVQEFPSAPRDSFMVANLAYLERGRPTPGPERRLRQDERQPGRRRLAGRRGDRARSEPSVKNIDQQTAQTVSSITTVDLTGISHIEEVFAIVLVAAAMALFVARRRRRAPARVRDDGGDRRLAARRRRLRVERGGDRARRRRRCSRPGSAGCWPGCWWRC